MQCAKNCQYCAGCHDAPGSESSADDPRSSRRGLPANMCQARGVGRNLSTWFDLLVPRMATVLRVFHIFLGIFWLFSVFNAMATVFSLLFWHSHDSRARIEKTSQQKSSKMFKGHVKEKSQERQLNVAQLGNQPQHWKTTMPVQSLCTIETRKQNRTVEMRQTEGREGIEQWPTA